VGMASSLRSVGLRFFQVSLIVTLMLGGSSSTRAGVTSFEMVAPNVGWATATESYGGRDSLFWTTDGGVHWRNITPNPFTNSEYPRPVEFRRGDVEPEKIASVFFLDTHKGWVLFCCGQSESTDAEGDTMPQYDLAMTTDSGTTWSIARVNIPAEIHDNVKFVDNGQIRFADFLHGWMNMTSCNYGHTCLAQMITTSDGGRSWHPVEEGPPGAADPFSLVTRSLGWQVSIPNGWVGDDENAELYITRDGSRNWKQVSLPFPTKMLSSAFAKKSRPSAYYGCLPTFTDSKHGFLPVIYTDENDGWKAAIVLFETADAGKSWQPIRSITNLYLPGMNASFRVEVADSTLFAITTSKDEKHIMLSKDGPDGRTDTDLSSYFRVEGQLNSAQLSFATSRQGWMLGEEMYSTTDGGATWTTLSPRSEETTPATCCMPLIHFPIDSMQLLSPTVGWASWEGDLFWTEDKGLTWTQITPARNLFGSHKIFSVFFLDTRRGWALSADAVLSTIDAGAHWSMTKLDVSYLQERLGRYGTVGQIYFADSLHGWVSLDVDSGREGHKSWLLITSDGGGSWQPAPRDPGLSGSIRLVTPMEGWIRSPLGDALLVTHDGARCWKKVSLTPPKDGYSNSDATYDLPMFEDSKHGFLPVTYTGGLGTKAIAVLYATEDGGLTWKSDSTLTNLASRPIGNGVSSTVVGSTWIIATELDSGNSNPAITPIASGGTLAAGYNSESDYYGARQLSFVTPSQGWVLVSENRLTSTSDGGATWTELNPRQSEQASLAHPGPHARVMPTLIGSMQLLGPTTGVVTAVHSGTLEEGNFHLMRTDDDGAQWKDISPLMTTTEGDFSNYFFLDSNHGWLVLWNLTPAVPRVGKPQFELESTTDGGATWSSTHIAVPELESLKGKILSGAKISFVDPVHGWMSIVVSGVGTIDIYWETTADGGKTWSAASSSTIRPAGVRFVTPTQAWMIDDPSTPAIVREAPSAIEEDMTPANMRGFMMPGMPKADGFRPLRRIGGGGSYNSPSSNDLYVTRDGAKSWQKASFAAPKEVYPPGDASNTPLSTIYSLPTFTDSAHGFLPVTYTAGTNPDFYYHAVLFETADGGKTWKPDRTLFSHSAKRRAFTYSPGTVLSAVEGSTWVVASHPLEGPPSLTTVDAGSSLDISPTLDNQVASAYGNDVFCQIMQQGFRFDFVTPSSGWVVWRGALLSTKNGGGTWTPITPELPAPPST
jgi:photosystem II stability/assembly factor-like uncharacterized protein